MKINGYNPHGPQILEALNEIKRLNDLDPKQYTIDQMISEVEHENRDTEHPNL